MAEFLRPEARQTLWRWREVLIALPVLALGLRWALAGVGLTVWLGWICAAAGIALFVGGIQRGRFRSGQSTLGPGVVTVDERRLVYYGPETGGVVDLDDLDRLEHDPVRGWILTGGGQVLAVPVDALGAEVLFDSFAALPGLPLDRLASAPARRSGGRQTLWKRARTRIS